MMMNLADAGLAMNGEVMGLERTGFDAVQFDSRKVKSKDLFFAIRGHAQDGHQYIDSAIENGASAVVMDKVGARQHQQVANNAIVVSDTTLALGDLAKVWRREFEVPVVGITGSNGKTTVSRILSEIFSNSMPGIAPEGSFNNHWGVPMTLLKLRKVDHSAVIEMGMNHPGELSYLGDIASPTIGVITNAAAAHLEGLIDVEGVAHAKGELIGSVRSEGCVVLNMDDPFYNYWYGLANGRTVISFGVNASADVQLLASKLDSLKLAYDGQELTIPCSLLGEHNHLNVLAAVSAALCAGINLQDAAASVANVNAVDGRLQIKSATAEQTLIDDTYNANPASMMAAIQVLCAYNAQKVLVLGHMGELGTNSSEQHRAVGEAAKAAGVDQLVVFNDLAESRSLAEQYIAGFGAEGQLFTDLESLSGHFESQVKGDAIILVKGSRAAKMERIVKALVKEKLPC